MLSISMETSLVTALLITLTNCIVPGWKPGQVNGEFQTDWLCLVLMRDAQGTAPSGTQLWFALGSFSLMAKTHPKENPNTFIWSCMRPAFSKEKSSWLAEQFFFFSQACKWNISVILWTFHRSQLLQEMKWDKIHRSLLTPNAQTGYASMQDSGN